jgi:hypothetical protein
MIEIFYFAGIRLAEFVGLGVRGPGKFSLRVQNPPYVLRTS